LKNQKKRYISINRESHCISGYIILYVGKEEKMEIINCAIKERLVEEMKKEALSGSIQSTCPNDCPKELCPKCRVQDG